MVCLQLRRYCQLPTSSVREGSAQDPAPVRYKVIGHDWRYLMYETGYIIDIRHFIEAQFLALQPLQGIHTVVNCWIR